MTNKEYMSRAFLISKRLKARRQRLAYLKSLVGTTNQVLTGMPKGSPSSTSYMEDQTVRILDLESAIAKGNENYASILQMRYLDYMDWMDIMRSMDYCRSYLYKLHGRAIQMVRQKT